MAPVADQCRTLSSVPTPAERQALLFVAAVAALGVGVRGCRSIAHGEPPAVERAALAAQLAAVDSAVASGGARRPSAPPRRSKQLMTDTARWVRAPAARQPARRSDVREPGPLTAERVDLDVAGVAELDRLPGIGPALAGRIVADRELLGPFGSVQGLERVKGIGPSLAAKLEPHVTFSLPPRLSGTELAPGQRVVRP